MNPFGTLTYPEISSQDAAVQKAWEKVKLSKDWIDRYLTNPKYDEVIFIGSGSSYYQALTMASTYRKWTGKSAVAHPSSEIFLFRDASAAINKQYLLVGVSRSGESSEVILALDSVAALPNWDTCGITCYEESKMAAMTDCLVSPLGKELSTVMTKSLSSMTFLMQAAIAVASGISDYEAEMEQTAALIGQVTKQADSFIKKLVDENSFNKIIYLGMGAYYGLALEAGLKLKEMSYAWTESYGTLEFRHGPKSIVDPGTLVTVLLSEQARSYELKVAEEMKQYGATILLITSEAGPDTDFADAVFVTGGKQLSDEARSVLCLPAVQYFGYYTALKKKVDPDHPRNLTQVVKI